MPAIHCHHDFLTSRPHAELPVAVRTASRSETPVALQSRTGTLGAPQFWSIWQEAEQALFRICLSCLNGRQADAEEALSTARIKAYTMLCVEGRPVDSVVAWLKCMTRNLCIDSLRMQKVRENKAVRIDQMPMDIADPRTSQRPEMATLCSDMFARHESALDNLPPKFSQVWKMRIVEEMEFRTMAVALNTTEANVRKRLQFARAILRERMEG